MLVACQTFPLYYSSAPPKLTKRPENTEVLEGSSADLKCEASGHPVPAIAWTKSGDRLPSQDRHIVLPSGTLRVIYASLSDQGEYECQAINVIGVGSVKAFLTVKPRGRFKEKQRQNAMLTLKILDALCP